MGSFSVPALGMSDAVAQLNKTAARLASATAALANPDQSGDVVSLSDEMVALMQARTMFQANVESAKTVDEIQQSTLSILG